MGNRAVFLDRDGTLIEHYDYLTDPKQVQLLTRSVSALRLLKEHGFLLVVVTNQSGVARGMLTEKKLGQIHDHLQSLLSNEGVFLDKIYYCPYHPEAVVDKYRQDSDLRKPKPGMLQLAGRELDIDISQSWVVGDDDRDIEAGRAAGCHTIMLEARGSNLVRKGQSKPDFYAVNLQEAANLIIRYGDKDLPEKKVQEAKQNNIASVSDEDTTLKTKSEKKEEKTDHDRFVSDAFSDEDTVVEDDNKSKEQTGIIEQPAQSRGDPEPMEADTNMLLGQILRELKGMNRAQSHKAEFSLGKLFAGVVQMLVLMCLILAFWFGTSPEPKTEVSQNCLLLALVFQTLALTLLITHRQR